MTGRYTVLTGGVGGAKLVDGLYRLLPANSLTAIVNAGDDFRHFGLPISPDIDTLLYTLSEKSNQALGWGREGETWSFMEAVRSLGGKDWFNLGGFRCRRDAFGGYGTICFGLATCARCLADDRRCRCNMGRK